MDRTMRVRSRGVAESNSAAMKWKKTWSGQEAWRRTEWTAAIEPRRYSESSVIATWTNDAAHDVAGSAEAAGQSTPLRYSRASENPARTASGNDQMAAHGPRRRRIRIIPAAGGLNRRRISEEKSYGFRV